MKLLSVSDKKLIMHNFEQREIENLLKVLPIEKLIELVDENRKRSDMGLNRIVCAANQYKNILILGPRHWDSTMHTAYKVLRLGHESIDKDTPFPLSHEFEQGFIDRHGNYKTRQEAWSIAIYAGQIIRRCGGDTCEGGTLYSENLY